EVGWPQAKHTPFRDSYRISPMFQRLFILPFRDAVRGLDRCLDTGIRGLALTALGLLAGWWLYVPLHELLHAAACLLAAARFHAWRSRRSMAAPCWLACSPS